MLDNQILYPISIVKPSGTRFEVVEEGETPVLDEYGNVVIPSTEQF